MYVIIGDCEGKLMVRHIYPKVFFSSSYLPLKKFYIPETNVPFFFRLRLQIIKQSEIYDPFSLYSLFRLIPPT